MSVNIESLGIADLSVADRLELIEQIWDTLPEPIQTNEIPAWHLAEIAARRQEAIEQPGLGVPWRDVMDRLDSGS